MREPYTIKRTADPASEPVSLAEAKLQCRVDTTAEDTYLTQCIAAAREKCEELHKGRVYITQTWRMTLEDWPRDSRIILPRGPVQSVSSITYVDSDGATQTLAANQYQVDTDAEPAVILPAYGVTWPTLRPDTVNAVKVTFVAGYGAAAAVPAKVKQAMLLLVNHWYEDSGRNAVLTGTVSKEVEFGVKALLGGDPLLPY